MLYAAYSADAYEKFVSGRMAVWNGLVVVLFFVES
jgi:hypothetical protein